MTEQAGGARAEWLRGLNPTAKLAAVLLLGAAAMAFPSPVLGACLIVVLFVVAASSGMLAPFAKLMVGFGIPVTIMLLFIQGCYSPANVTFIADLGFARLGLEGVMSALQTVVTLLVVCACACVKLALRAGRRR